MRKILLIFFIVVSLINSLKAEEYIISSVPFFPATQYQCGPASLATVLNFMGIKITPQQIAEEIYSETARGTSDFDLIFFVKKIGLKPVHYRGNLEDLKEKIRSNKLILVMIDEGIWFYKKYHFMVVKGFTDDSVIVNSGQWEGMKINNRDFIKKWSKTNFWTLLIENEREEI